MLDRAYRCWALALATWSACLAGPTAVGAQLEGHDPPWVVLPVSTGDPAETRRVLHAASQVLSPLETMGERVLRLDDAKLRFNERHSREPVTLSIEERERFIKLAQQAVESYAYLKRSAAAQQNSQAMSLARRALETLMTDQLLAELFLDACLLEVRSELDRGERQRAFDLTVACLDETLGAGMSPGKHPDDVRRMVERARHHIESRPGAKLTLRSDPPGCTVYLNGRAIAVTDTVVERAPRGTYRAHVACHGQRQPPRVHTVVSGAREAELYVDSRFEDSVRTGDGEPLRLELPERAELDRFALPYAQSIGRVLGARPVLVLSPAVDEVVLELPTRDGVARISLAYHTTAGLPSDVEATLRAVFHDQFGKNIGCTEHASNLAVQGELGLAEELARLCFELGERQPERKKYPSVVSEVFTRARTALLTIGAPPVALAASEPKRAEIVERPSGTAPPADSHGGDTSVAAWTGLAVGGSALLAASVLYVANPGEPGWVQPILSWPGAVLAGPSLGYLTRPSASEAPVTWWGLTLGGAGALAIASGIYALTLEGDCTTPSCTGDRYEVESRVHALLGVGAALVLVPVSQWLFQPGAASGVAVSVRTGPSAALVMLEETF